MSVATAGERPASPLFQADALAAFAEELLRHAGLPREKAYAVSQVLVEGDLMGHTTHGLQLLPAYLSELRTGKMEKEGEPTIVSDHGSTFVWDGCYLPGPWLVRKALDEALSRVGTHRSVSAAIRRSHHIASLAAYLREPAENGYVVLLMCSDPAGRCVAPHGGRDACYTPNPVAAAWPTADGPIIVDISASTITLGLATRMFRQAPHLRLSENWLVDGEGKPSSDPSVLFGETKGAILPLGGMEMGHKGFALGLIIEMLTSALAGHGRADNPTTWGASVYLQVMAPGGFAGGAAFEHEATTLARACRSARPRVGYEKVRLPGERALTLRSQQREQGVSLHPGIMEALVPFAAEAGVSLPGTL